MAIKPILFNKQISAKMVRAILDGRKTCTRRLVKFLPGENSQWTGYIKDGLMLYNGRNEPCIRKVPYQLGDILYVRETFAWCPCWDCGFDTIPNGCRNPVIYDSKKREHGCYMYRASCKDNEYPCVDTWHPSIHMPKKAARIWLKVTDVRVERLQEITEDGAKAEGANFKNGKNVGFEEKMNRTAIERFAEIWNSTLKKADFDRYDWDANPWVWVIEFERCEKTEEI